MGTDDQPTTFTALHADLLDEEGSDSYEEAWRRFCLAYEPRIRAWAAALRLNAGQIDELTSRVLARLVKAIGSYRAEPGKPFSAWLRVVVRNEARDFWASAVRRPGAVGVGGSAARDALAQEIDDDAGAATEILVAELDAEIGRRDQLVRRAIEAVKGRVKPDTWEIFTLTTFDGLSGKEAAERLGRSVASVHMARSRVAGMLRDELAALGLGAAAGADG